MKDSYKMKTHFIDKKINNTRVLSVIISIAVLMSSLCGCAGTDALKDIFSKKEEQTTEIILENNIAPDVIIVEKIEELDDSNAQVSELPKKDFDEAKNELIPDGLKYYAYDILSEDDKVLYTELFSILSNSSADIKVSSKDPEQIEKAFNYVMLDHPELFYLTGYSYTKYVRGGSIEKITVSGNYTMSPSEVELAKMDIESYVQKCVSGYNGPVDEYEKIKYVYEYLISNTEYDIEAPNNQNILSVVRENRTVCQGYAKMAQYLLNRMGVFCILCEGTVKGTEAHVWDIVRIKDKYYHMDVTWGDASYMVKEGDNDFKVPEINYDYLNITDNEIKETHVFKNNIVLPVCDSVEGNYYVREGLYLDELDSDIIACAFDRAMQDGESMVTLKCANANVYTALYNHLITNQRIFDYLNGSTSVNYVEFKDACRISFYI